LVGNGSAVAVAGAGKLGLGVSGGVDVAARVSVINGVLVIAGPHWRPVVSRKSITTTKPAMPHK
jgi:hypothetical protein